MFTWRRKKLKVSFLNERRSRRKSSATPRSRPGALSFGLEERRATDPDEVAHWLEIPNPLHQHESDEPE